MIDDKISIAPQPRQVDFLSSSADIAIYGGSAGGGKGHPLDVPIVTPYGMRAIGDIKVGQRICSPTHGNTNVIAVYELGLRDIYEVSFADKTSLRVTGDHLWLIWFARKGRDKKGLKYRLITTLQMMDYLQRGYHNLLISLPKPVQFTKVYRRNMLPVESYTLGILLGDGSLTKNECIFHTKTEHIAVRVANHYELTAYQSRVPSYRAKNAEAGMADLGLLGMGSEEKFIPTPYLFASIVERWKLAQGLFDADGSADKQGRVSYCSVSERLINDVAHLCRGLGFRVTVSNAQPAGYKNNDGYYVRCHDRYRLYVQGHSKDRLFSLPRKLKRASRDPKLPEVGKRITSVRLDGQSQARCIRVDNPNGLYIAGQEFIVTHNTWSLILEPLRHISNPGFGAVIFRRTFPQIAQEGGMWDETVKIYPHADGVPNRGKYFWSFPSGARIRFAYLQHDQDRFVYQGAQIALIGWDQLEQFSEATFFYLLSRNRSTCGVVPYIRATCNPDADSWLAHFLSWWIADDGYADMSRSGKLRWFIRLENDIVWADTKEELEETYEDVSPKSVTFIPATIYDNEILLKKDPAYLANLKALLPVDRARLLGDPERGGNWKIKEGAGLIFDRNWFQIVHAVPGGGRACLFWDFAATAKEVGGSDPAFTAAVLMIEVERIFYIAACLAFRKGPAYVDEVFRNYSKQIAQQMEQEGHQFMIRWETEPGSAGKRLDLILVKDLIGYDAAGRQASGDKIVRAKPLASQAQIGNVRVLAGDWNEMLLTHLHNQPSGYKDIMDACSGAFNELAEGGKVRIKGNISIVGASRRSEEASMEYPSSSNMPSIFGNR